MSVAVNYLSQCSQGTYKSIFARHGIPSVLFSDNGPQFNSTAFKEFSSLYHFQHITSSPRYPQSNGLAELTVKIVKALLTGASDPYLALLCYRAPPLPWCSISPAELLFGCKIATNIPQPDTHLSPDWPYLKASDKLIVLTSLSSKPSSIIDIAPDHCLSYPHIL